MGCAVADRVCCSRTVLTVFLNCDHARRAGRDSCCSRRRGDSPWASRAPPKCFRGRLARTLLSARLRLYCYSPRRSTGTEHALDVGAPARDRAARRARERRRPRPLARGSRARLITPVTGDRSVAELNGLHWGRDSEGHVRSSPRSPSTRRREPRRGRASRSLAGALGSGARRGRASGATPARIRTRCAGERSSPAATRVVPRTAWIAGASSRTTNGRVTPKRCSPRPSLAGGSGRLARPCARDCSSRVFAAARKPVASSSRVRRRMARVRAHRAGCASRRSPITPENVGAIEGVYLSQRRHLGGSEGRRELGQSDAEL